MDLIALKIASGVTVQTGGADMRPRGSPKQCLSTLESSLGLKSPVLHAWSSAGQEQGQGPTCIGPDPGLRTRWRAPDRPAGAVLLAGSMLLSRRLRTEDRKPSRAFQLP